MFSCKFSFTFTSQWYNDKGSIEGPKTTGIKDTPSQPFPSPPLSLKLTVDGLQAMRHRDGLGAEVGDPLSSVLIDIHEVYRFALHGYRQWVEYSGTRVRKMPL